jgi:hypothetical protein
MHCTDAKCNYSVWKNKGHVTLPGCISCPDDFEDSPCMIANRATQPIAPVISAMLEYTLGVYTIGVVYNDG